MKNNYPIKYAVIPMIEQVGLGHGINELERNYEIVYYIVSKCYLVGENKKYNIDGTITTRYHVVCPFNKDEYQNWRREEPTYNLVHGNCTNSITTAALFDNFDEAKALKKQKNKNLHVQKFACMPIDTYKLKHQKIEDEFNKIANYYDKLESKIKYCTEDLLVNNEKKEQRVLQLKDNKCKKINLSLYEVINIFSSNNYIVYSITNEEFTRLQNLITGSRNFNECAHVPLLINNGKLNATKVVSPTGEIIYLSSNKLTEQIDRTFEIPSVYDETFYTVEDYEDIIKSYKNNCDNTKVIKLVRK